MSKELYDYKDFKFEIVFREKYEWTADILVLPIIINELESLHTRLDKESSRKFICWAWAENDKGGSIEKMIQICHIWADNNLKYALDGTKF